MANNITKTDNCSNKEDDTQVYIDEKIESHEKTEN